MADKKSKVIVYHNWDEVNQALRELGEIDRSVTRIEADMNRKINEIKADAERDAASHLDRKAKLEKNRFKQQTLPAWRPVPTLVSSLITFLVFGVIFLTLGIVLVVYSKNIQEVSIQYNDT